MRAARTCRFCLRPFAADVDEDGYGQEACGPCDAAFDAWLDAKIAEAGEELKVQVLNFEYRARQLSESVLATIDGLDRWTGAA